MQDSDISADWLGFELILWCFRLFGDFYCVDQPQGISQIRNFYEFGTVFVNRPVVIRRFETELHIRLQPRLIAGLIFRGDFGADSRNNITLVETISWKWSQFLKAAIAGSMIGLIPGLIAGMIGLFSGFRVDQGLVHIHVEAGLIGALVTGLFFGLIGGLSFGMFFGLIGGFTASVKVGKASPNQGIKLSLKNSLTVFLVTSLLSGLIFWGVSKAVYPDIALMGGLIVGPMAGLIIALIRGGSAVIKHYALRLILWRKGYTPFKFIKFLDQCAKLIFLKKVGGGYIFIHRMLLEYFADMAPQSTKTQDSVKKGG